MVVTHCGQSGLNALKPVEAEHEPVKEPVPTLPLWGMERAAIIWVNQRRIRNAMKIRALIVSGLKKNDCSNLALATAMRNQRANIISYYSFTSISFKQPARNHWTLA